MKVYTKSNGEKTVYINNKETKITENEAKVIEMFKSEVNRLCENYTPMVNEADETILKRIENSLSVNTTTLEGNGVKYELHILEEFYQPSDLEFDTKFHAFRCFKNGKEITNQLPNDVEKVMEITKKQGFK